MSQVEAAISQKAAQVPPGTFRHTVLLAAKRFKASWVELGKLLVKVRDDALFEQWGYETFESYCAREIHIRKATAYKLVRSFTFLNRHEPKAVASDDIAERAPAFEVVEVLAEAEERGQLTAAEYRDVRDTIWESERPTSELRRELTERFPRPAPAAVADAVVLRRLAQAAKSLASQLGACRRVPKTVAERAAALADDVEELAAQRADA
jgi:hypothetical protein